MTAGELREELEKELAWRQEELAFFKNQLNGISGEIEKGKYRKSLVLILYSHYEGFMKIALQTYIKYINAQRLARRDVVSELCVAGMDVVFRRYEDPNRKSEVFRSSLPDDSALHRFSRRVDFWDELETFEGGLLEIDDSVIDTESNLRCAVLKKNLFKIGLPLDLLKDHESEINALVNRRNGIAHGGERSGVSETEYARWERSVYAIFEDTVKLLFGHAYQKRYLRP